jgi:1-deoxy-D-xylulose-5-phosphate synthase
VPDIIVEHGTQRELHDEVGIGPAGIMEEVRRSFGVLVEADK